MGEQLELFETAERQWIKRLWESMSPEARKEVVDLLAEIGKTALKVRKAGNNDENKEEWNES